MNKLRGRVESVTTKEVISEGFAQCLIVIDFSEFIIFYNPTDLNQFVGEEVLYTTRPDIVNGIKREVICEIALVTEVVSTEKITNDVKLIPFDLKRPVCNFNIKDIKFGDFKQECIGILTAVTPGSSRKASWYDCSVLDAYGHLFDLRLFAEQAGTGDTTAFIPLMNNYIMFDINSTKYGYQTSEISGMEQQVEASPEIAIAKKVVMNYINSDEDIHRMAIGTQFENFIDQTIDGEKGYLWVYMASELYMIDALDNITSGLNISTLKRAVICTRLYACAPASVWARSVTNATVLMKYKEIKNDAKLRSIIDVFVKDTTDTQDRDTYLMIRGLVNKIINTRRGLTDEEVSNSIISCCNAFNGLL